MFDLGMRGKDENRDIRKFRTNLAGCVEAFGGVPGRHPDVHDYQSRLSLAHQCEQRRRGSALPHNIEARAFEQTRETLSQQDVVVRQGDLNPVRGHLYDYGPFQGRRRLHLELILPEGDLVTVGRAGPVRCRGLQACPRLLADGGRYHHLAEGRDQPCPFELGAFAVAVAGKIAVVGDNVESMRAARLYGAADLRVGEEPAPDAAAGQSLVRVTAVGICGSDLHWYSEGGIGDAKISRPLVPGHEGAGEVADGPRRGERVAIDPAVPCERCRACRDGYRNLCYNIVFSGHGETDGMMRELMPWPSHLLHPLPDSVSDAGGAMLEPLGVALWALDLGHVPFGGSVAVVGGGPVGLLLIQLLRAAGASWIVTAEPLAHRREAAVKWGADEVVTPRDDISGFGADVAFELAGNDDAVRIAFESVRPGGRVVLGGIPDSDATTFRASLARRKGLTIAMVRRMNEVYPRAIDLAARGVVALDPLVSSRTPLTDAAHAFAAAQGRTGLKAIIAP
jgi:L-iditol 2-dehydrogenase